MVASGGGGGGAICVVLSDGDAPLSPELTIGANGDAVDWYAPSPPVIVLQGGKRDVMSLFRIKRTYCVAGE